MTKQEEIRIGAKSFENEIEELERELSNLPDDVKIEVEPLIKEPE
jgi:hypothetical protein